MTRPPGKLKLRGGLRVSAIALIVVLVCAGPAFAQGLAKGVRGGVNLTTTVTTDDDGSAALDWQARPVLAGFVTWRVASWLQLQPEVIYALKGAKSEEFDISSKLLLDYVEVPLLARFSMGSLGGKSLYVVAGPTFGLLVRAKTRADFGGATEELDVSDDVERFDLGIAVGGGIELGSIVVDGRYTHGLSDIDKDASDDAKVRNRAVSLTVGFRF